MKLKTKTTKISTALTPQTMKNTIPGFNSKAVQTQPFTQVALPH